GTAGTATDRGRRQPSGPPYAGRGTVPTGSVDDLGRGRARRSVRRPGDLRHTARSAESCCLPTLTRFTVCCCAGPSRRTDRRARRPRYPAEPATPEGCESGRIGTPGERVSRKGPWVQIPLPPLRRERSGFGRVAVDEAVADAGLGDETGAVGVLAQLFAQLVGVDAEVLRLAGGGGAPHLGQDAAVGQHLAGVARQQGEEGELLRREVDGLPADTDPVPRQVDADVADLEHVVVD